MTRFTSGPWSAGAWGYDYPIERTLTPEFIITAQDNAVVAHVRADPESGITGAVVEANARLISAAADLYSALVCFFEADFNDDTKAVWDRARAALAKAEGRQL